jgi:hypothetical protein
MRGCFSISSIISRPGYLVNCEGVAEGTREVGESCPGGSQDCNESSVCDSCTIACVREGERELGQPCQDDRWCRPPYQCAFTGGGGVCSLVPGVGQPCTTWCSGSAYCRRDTRTCVLPATAGNMCGEDVICEDGLYCKEGLCAPRSRVGEACEPQPVACVPGAYCDSSTYLCTLFAGPGNSCSTSQCHVDLKCDSNSACAAPQALGEACESALECAFGGCDERGKCDLLDCIGGVCDFVARCN